MTGPKSLLEARDGLVPRRDRAPGARAARALPGAAAARPDAQLPHPRGLARSAEGLRGRPRLPPAQGPKLRADDLTAGRVAGEPGARVVPARPRRPLRGAAGLRDARRRCSSRACGTRSSPTPTTSARCSTRSSSSGSPSSGAPFAMETVIGTEADRKGGHIAWRDGRLVLRETAQAAPEEADSFRDFRRWRYYNTNNLWLDLEALAALDAPPDLPLIVNRKTVDPSDPMSTAGDPDRDRDGRRDRRLRRRAGAVRAALALRAGQDHRRPAGAALGRLPAAARRARRGLAEPPYIALDPTVFQADRRTSSSASRTVRPHCGSAGASSSAATCRSARASSRAAASRSVRMSRDDTVLSGVYRPLVETADREHGTAPRGREDRLRQGAPSPRPVAARRAHALRGRRRLAHAARSRRSSPRSARRAATPPASR